MSNFQTSPQRHANMAAIKSKDTKPEMVVRRYLWGRGFRYRLNQPRLPGKPDIVMRKYRTCIFVNGCFWHGHEGCRYYTIPKTNTEFWVNKVKRNKERDLKVQHELAAMGWHSIIIWECELKPVKREDTLESLTYTLNKIFLQDRTVKRYEIPEEEPMIAAEDAPTTYKKSNMIIRYIILLLSAKLFKRQMKKIGLAPIAGVSPKWLLCFWS